MRKIGKLSYKSGVVFLILVVLASIQTVKASYDSTYVLSVKQKYAIPEVVENNDDVGIWRKTFTWMSKGTITYSIERNFRSAFSINSTSGLITISDASGINGKIVQQDTVINLIIRTTDNLIGYELDTCEIRVKEKSYCVFYNLQGSQGNGTRANPYNTLSSVAFKPGYGYFIKRGTVSDGETTVISGIISEARHPMLIAAYGKGKKPVFDGTNAPAQSQCFYIGDEDNQEAGRCEYLYVYDVDIKDYTWCAMEVYRTSRNLGFYNLLLHNNDINGRQSMFVISTSSYEDTTSYDPFELIDCEFDTVGRVTNFEPSHIKIGSGPIYITNCRFGSSARAGVRFADGNHGGVMKHCLVETGRFTDQISYYSVQVRMDNTTIEDCRISGGSSSIYLTAPGDANCYEMQPHHVTIKNCYLENAVVAGIWVAPPNDQYQASTGHVYKDNLIKNTRIGIRDRNGNGTIIQRNRIFNTSQGIYISDEWSGKGRNIKVLNNLIYGCSDKAVYIVNGDKYSLVRNTVNGQVDVSGATNTTVINNIYSSLTGGSTVNKNLEIGSLTTSDYFVNFKENDYCLKTTASKAINQGVSDGIAQDYAFNPIVGNPDIGAWEYVENTVENPPDTDTPPVEPPVVVKPPSPNPIVTDGNIYIDPENTGDALENGTKDHPYNSWADVKWAEGKSYLQKKGTTSNEDKVIIGASNVKIGSYGTGDLPRIVSKTTTYLISSFEKKNISITGLQLDAPNSVSTVYFLGSTSDNITIEMCVLKGSENSIRIVEGKHFTIRYNTISSEGEGISSSAESNDLYYNIFKENDVAILIPSVLSKARIYNNVFAGNNESVSSTYADLTIYNNIFYFFENGQKAIKHLSAKISSDNNIYFPQQDGFVSIAGQSYSTLDQLQKEMKVDLNSFEKDPLFVDILANDFNVANNSPAIDNGVNINITKDFIGTSVPHYSAPDIGILEFTGLIANQDKSSLKVYPNPSSGILNIDFQEVLENETVNPQASGISSPVLKLADLSGRVLITRSVSNSDNSVESLDLSSMANGIYLVIFERLGKKIVEKVILSR
jgi:hypothetical protein